MDTPAMKRRLFSRSVRLQWLPKAVLFGATVMVLPTAGRAQEAAAPPAEAQARKGQDYVVGAGDVLQVFVWKEPELTKDVTVRIDGKITVPLVGEVQAAGRTPGQLTADLRSAMERFLAAPRVTVGILQPNSARFYVMGQVAKPGDFPLTGRLTVLQGLALAGGFREFAKTETIVILRQEGGSQTTIPVNYKRLEGGKEPSQNVELRPGDTILVP